jgi:hypothetical protein
MIINAKDSLKKDITFTATAEGGSSIETDPIGIEVKEKIKS